MKRLTLQTIRTHPLSAWLIGGAFGIAIPSIRLISPEVYTTFIAISIVMGMAGLAAFGFGAWYTRRGKYNEHLLRLLFWSNLITWLIPILGFFTGMATNQINARNHGADKRKYMLLGSLGFLLSLAHIIVKITHVITW